MTSLGKDCYTENLNVTVLGSNGNPVHTIYRASTDYFQNDLNWIETDSDDLRFRLKEDGHLQIVEGLELFHGTEDLRTATKQFSVGLNSAGGFVVRDEVHSRDVISISSGGQLHLDISQVNGLQAAIDSGQQQFFTQGGLSVNSTVLDTFALTASGDGAGYNRYLVTAKALEDYLEGFQESVITVLPGQDSGHRISTITSTPSSTNVPSALAVSNYVNNRLNSFTGSINTPFSAASLLVGDVNITPLSGPSNGLELLRMGGGQSETLDINRLTLSESSSTMRLQNNSLSFANFVVGELVTVGGISTELGGVSGSSLSGDHPVTAIDSLNTWIEVDISPSVALSSYSSIVLGPTVSRHVSAYGNVYAGDYFVNNVSLLSLLYGKQPTGDYALNSLVNTKIDQPFADGRYQQLANVPAAQIYSGRTTPGLHAYIQQSSTTSNQFTMSFFVHTGPENYHLQGFELAVFWRQERCQLAFINVGNAAHPWDGVTDALQQPSTSSAQPLPQRRRWTIGSGYTSYNTIAQTAAPDSYYDIPSYRVVFTQSTIDENTSVWNQAGLPSYEFNKNNGSCFVCTLVFNIAGDWVGTQEVIFQANSRGFVNQGTQNYDSLVPHTTADDGFNYAFRDAGGDWDESNRIPILDVTSDGVDKFEGFYQRGLSLPGTNIKDNAISTTTATVTTLNSSALTKGLVNVLNETETDGRYATQTALSTYGGNAGINFNASTVTLNNQVRFAPHSYTQGLFSFLALSVRDIANSQYYPLFCSDIYYGTSAQDRLTTKLQDIWSALAGKHPLTVVDETTGGTLSSASLITSGAVRAGNAALQSQIDGLQPAGAYLTGVPANTNSNLIADGTVSNTMFQYLGGVTSSIQGQLNSKASNFSTDSTPTSGSSNLVTSGGVFDAINAADHVTPIHDGFLSVSGNMTCAATLRTDGSLRCNGDATFNGAVIAGAGYIQSSDFRHTGPTINLGLSSGSLALNSIAIGVEAARWGQSTGGVAIGLRAGLSVQATDSICIGTDAGRENAGARSINIGRQACFAGAAVDSIGIGNACGNLLGARAIAIGIGSGVNAEADCVCLGPYAGGITPETRAVAIGSLAGFDQQGSEAVAIGYLAGTSLQSLGGVAVGAFAARFSQGNNSVAVGRDAGREFQNFDCVAVGYGAGLRQQGARAIGVGLRAGALFQGDAAIAIGSQAQNISAGASAVALGGLAGYDRQGAQSVAIGNQTGMNVLGASSVMVGRFCGHISCGASSVGIGDECLRISAGSNCIGIGYRAGYTGAHSRTIALNAQTTALNTQTSDACYIAPIRSANGTTILQYDDTSKEITHSNTLASVTASSLSVSTLVVGTSVALPTSLGYIAFRHSYINTLSAASTLNHSNASTFTNIVLGSDFGTWGSGSSFRAAFNDIGYDEHGGFGVFTPPSAYGNRLFRLRCSITAECIGSAAIYIEILKSGTVVTSARLPVANCMTTVETMAFVDGITESISFRLRNASSDTWSLSITHKEPHLGAMSWELQ